MKKQYLAKLALICSLFLILRGTLQAQEKICFITNDKQNISLDSLIFAAEVSKIAPTTLAFAKTLSYKPYEERFTDLPIDKNYWGKVILQNKMDKDVHFAFSLGDASLITYFIVDSTDNLKAIQKAGNMRKASEKPIKYASSEYFYTFTSAGELYLKPNEKVTIYALYEFQYPDVYTYIYIGGNLIPYEDVYKFFGFNNLWQGLFQGAIWVMLIYNLLLVIVLRQKVYVYYIGYMFFTSLFYGDFMGFWRQHIYGDYPIVGILVNNTAYQVAITFYLLFMRKFLNMRQDFPFWYKVAGVWIVLRTAYTSVIFLSIFDSWNYALATKFVEYPFYLEIALIVTLLIATNWRKNILARFFAVGTTFYMIGFGFFMIFTRLITGIENTLYPVSLDVHLGIILEIICFSLGLGYKARKTEQEKKEAQAKLIEQLQANEKLQAEYALKLENEVREQTKELRILFEKNQETLLQVQAQKKVIEEKNKDITDSINYALNIQKALLPFVSRMNQDFGEENYFVFNKPRDIVSGDFYWYHVIRNEEGQIQSYILVAADCTGHGVPGAFMSILGINFLEEIVQIMKIYNPEAILQELDKMLVYRLKLSQSQQKDGINLGICVINFVEKIIEFAGAGHPLYLYQNNQLQEINADFYSVGGLRLEENVFFQKHTLSLPKNTFSLYMATDGFQDQFGEKTGKKLLKKNFKKILEKYAHETMSEQLHYLQQEFEQWKGKEEQVDDVLIWGISIKVI